MTKTSVAEAAATALTWLEAIRSYPYHSSSMANLCQTALSVPITNTSRRPWPFEVAETALTRLLPSCSYPNDAPSIVRLCQSVSSVPMANTSECLQAEVVAEI